MEAEKKEEIKKDLIKFSQSKEYYAKMGKAWKPGYLLYGPPGTGKSTMVAAMANLLNYDVYDLELTTVKDNMDKLDPALIRRGRMDKHIELSYCRFEAFKVLAKNYFGIESHHLFATIELLLKQTNMTPADVAANLMPNSVDEEDVEISLNRLTDALDIAKEEARKKFEEEAAWLKAEDEDESLTSVQDDMLSSS